MCAKFHERQCNKGSIYRGANRLKKSQQGIVKTRDKQGGAHTAGLVGMVLPDPGRVPDGIGVTQTLLWQRNVPLQKRWPGKEAEKDKKVDLSFFLPSNLHL